jgi:hypothetical protein
LQENAQTINIRTMPPNNQYFSQPLSAPPNPMMQQLPPQKKQRNWVVIALMSLLGLLLISALGFGYWAFSGRQDYKNNSDQKVTVAVKKANDEQKKTLEASFEEREKSPYKSYTSAVQYGSVKIVYSKMWSSYIIEQTAGSGTLINGYMYPDFVPDIGANDKNNYHLRFQIIDTQYNAEINKYASFIKSGKLTSTPFAPPQVQGAIVGVKLDGQLESKKAGSMVILPLRDKTIKIWTENQSAVNDFNNIVLKNLSYTP